MLKSEQNWASYGISAVVFLLLEILDQMLGDSDKMLGIWKNKSLENSEQKFGGNLPQLSTGGISRLKFVPDTHKYLKEPVKNF